MLKTQTFFDLSDFNHADLFRVDDYCWQPLNDLKKYMDTFEYPKYCAFFNNTGKPLSKHLVLVDNKIVPDNDIDIIYGDTTKGKLLVKKNNEEISGASVIMAGSVLVGDKIALGRGVLIEPGAMIKSPAIIDDMSEVRQGAYLRGYCLCGKRCVLGHTTEIKHTIFLDDAKAGHFAYLGDSILGNNVNLGAGSKFANLKFLPGNVAILANGKKIDTRRRKFGAVLGDNCQTGCNSVTSPGTLMAKGAILLPNTTAKGGFYPEKAIIR